MILKSVQIKNYRSIEDVTIDFTKLPDDSYTYGLIGVNEAGKSTILKALALKDGLVVLNQKDFKKKEIPVEISYNLIPENSEIEKLQALLTVQTVSENTKKTQIKQIQLIHSCKYESYNTPSIKVELIGNDSDSINTIPETSIPTLLKLTPKTIFWTAEERYLISQPINLQQFAASPDIISVPLRNCFYLSGFTDIKEKIASLTDSTEKEELQTSLGEMVTAHIKNVWSEHPIKITFLISDGLINFHIKDENSKGKAKTADQRSDGFRQFVSFLLTLSAESRNQELKNTIVLLDEPETHLHPKAQEDLLCELVNLTKNSKQNIVLFATHSNYMVDKDNLERNIKIMKPKDSTEIQKFNIKTSTYASVNFDAFDIASTDYHNELYGIAQERSGIEDGTKFDNYIRDNIVECPNKNYQHTNGNVFNCTLPTYIRHLIHHPENSNNKRFTNDELRESIKVLLSLIANIKPVADEKH